MQRAARRQATRHRRAVNGVNISGPEFPVASSAYGWPGPEDWLYLRRRGIRLVRLPIAWERLQQTLSDILDVTYLALIKTCLSDAERYGFKVIVDLHNFARWCSLAAFNAAGYPGTAGGSNILGDATLTTTVFADVWTRLATALSGYTSLAGYAIMNEPHDMVLVNLLKQPNGFSGASWAPINGGVVTAGAGAGPLGANDAWTLTSGTGFGGILQPVTVVNVPHTLSVYAKTASGTQPLLLMIGAANQGFTVTTAWQRFSFVNTPAAGTPNIILAVNAAAGNSFLIADAQLEAAGAATAYKPSPWTPFAQAACDAIRAVDAKTPIYVNGYNYGTALNWAVDNDQLVISGDVPIIYEAHQYFDGVGAGTYPQTYDVQGATPGLGATRVAPFVTWCLAHGYTGFLGEFGVPNDDRRWVTLQDNFLAACRAGNIVGTEWFYGPRGVQDSGRLNVSPKSNKGEAPQMSGLVLY